MSESFMTTRLVPAQAAALAACVNGAFRHERAHVDPAHVERLLSHPDHFITGAFFRNELVGFCDSFTTHVSGTARWEIDLLGVVPRARGRGIARMLVQEAMFEGLRRRASVARALVRRGNRSAERVFASSRFAQSDRHSLWTADPVPEAPSASVFRGDVIPVATLMYDGVWVERADDLESLIAARSISPEPGTVIGTVVPAGSPADTWAKQAGYRLAGQYHWWTLPY